MLPNRKFTGIAFISLLLSSAGTVNGASLIEVYKLAQENDPVIASSKATFQANQTIKTKALAELLPAIDGSYLWRDGASNFNSLAPKFESETWNVSLTQNLFNLQALFGYRQSNSIARQSLLSYSADQQELIIRVAEAYFNVLRGEDNLTSAKAEERAIERQLEQTQQRYEVGLIAITDVHEAQAAFDLTVANRLSLESDLGIAKESLALITGEYIETISRLAPNFAATPPDPSNIEAWLSFATENNLELALAEERLKEAKENARVKNSAFAPVVVGTVNYNKNDGKTAFGTASPTGNNFENDDASISVSLPIFSGGRRWAEKKEAGYQRVAEQANLVNAKRQVIQNTRSQFLLTKTDAARVGARQRAIMSTTSALDATQAGYDAGTRNIVDLLNAQRDLYAAQRDHANSRYDYIINSLRLKQAAGTISAKDLESIPLEAAAATEK